jgi:hypothetical protein
VTSIGQTATFLIKEDQSGVFQWKREIQCKSPSNYGFVGPVGIAVDSARNIYLSGAFYDTIDVDPGADTFYLASASLHPNLYLIKLDSFGTFIWGKQIGGGYNSSAVGWRDMKISSTGIYILAAFGGTIDVDPGSGTTNITPVTSPNALLLEKIDTGGNYMWAKQIDNAGGMGLDLDSFSNIYVGGTFSSTVDFDPSSAVNSLTATPPASLLLDSEVDIFVSKFNSLGDFIWAKKVGGGYGDFAQGLSVDNLGNPLITGYFGDTADFDPGPGLYSLVSNSTRSAFTFKLNTNGDFLWAKKTGGFVGLFDGRAITTDSVGNVYTALELPGPCDINPGPGTYLTSGVAVQKLDSSGNFVWGAGFGASIPGWIGLDHNNSVYTTGNFSGSFADFDPGPDTFALSAGSNQGSGFILKLCQNPAIVSLEVSDSTACTGDTITLTATSLQNSNYHWYKNGSALPDTSAVIKLTSTGTYIVEAGNGCSGYDSISVFFWPLFNPTITVPGVDFTAQVGQLVNLNASVIGGGWSDTIDWYKNGVLDTIYHSTSISFFKTTGIDSLFAVIHKRDNPCYFTDTNNMRIVSVPTGIEDQYKQNISVFPNPSTGMFTITSPDLIDEIEVMEMSGAVVYEAKPKSKSAHIDLSHRADVVYFYKLKLNDGWVRGKLVVAHSD